MTAKNLLLLIYFALLPVLYLFSESTAEKVPLRKSAEQVAILPQQVRESSGLALASPAGTFWTHNDANNGPVLYKVDSQGRLLESLHVPKADNVDWEDLAQDLNGNLFIGDFGNNHCHRQNLCIYKFNPEADDDPEQILFYYSDQTDFRLPEEKQNFDCEAMFWENGQLYLISKDRGTGQVAKLYTLPDQPGDYEALLIDSCRINGAITSADLSPDRKKMALLSKNVLHIFYLSPNSKSYFNGHEIEIPLGNTGKTEAVVFSDDYTLYFTNEEGQLFRIRI